MDPMSFRVRLRLLGGGALEVAVAGELDVAVADDLAAVSRLVRKCAPTSVELDLGGVTFVDLHGLRSLDGLCRDQQAHGIPVHERSTPACVEHLRDLVLTAEGAPASGRLALL
jgi:anti-anti-sigma regulatory factor